MRMFIQGILFWIAAPFLAKAFVILLATILVACMYRYLRPLEQLSWELRRFSRWDRWESPDVPPTRGRAAKAFETFRKRWKESVATLGAEERGMVAPEECFTTSLLLSDLGRAIPLALPGVFAGVGILGTFLGIVLGLSGVGLGNADQLMDSVESLLGGMSTAFVSSIVGIAFSVFWLILHRALVGHVEAKLREVCQGLSARYRVWDSGAVLRVSLVTQQKQLLAQGSQLTIHGNQLTIQRKQLKAQQEAIEQQLRSVTLADEQKGILQNLGTDIAEALEVALSKAVTPALSGLTESFGALSEDIRGQQMDGIGELAKEFREQLMESVNEDFERLSSGLQQAADVQEKTAEELSTFLAELVRVSEGQTELLEATALASEEFTSSIQGLSEIHAGIQESVPVLSGVAETAALLLADVKAQSDALSGANLELREALAQQVDEVQEQVDGLAEFGESFGGSLESFRAELQESIVEFRNVAAERLGEVFGQFDSEMAKVVEHLAGTMAELREVSEELPSRVQGLRTAVEGLETPVSRMADAFGTGQKSLDDYGEHLRRLEAFLGEAEPLEETLGRLDKRAGELTAAMIGLESVVAQERARDANGAPARVAPRAPEDRAGA